MLKPNVVMLDEPSLGLSPKLVTEASDTLPQSNEEVGTIILIVEQKGREVQRIATWVYAMRRGKGRPPD